MESDDSGEMFLPSLAASSRSISEESARVRPQSARGLSSLAEEPEAGVEGRGPPPPPTFANLSFDDSKDKSRLGDNPYLNRPAMKINHPLLPRKFGSLLKVKKDLGKQDVLTTGTKIVVTLGPACQDVDTLCEMIKGGMSCARVDLTNGDADFHVRSFKNVTEACQITRQFVAIMVDTMGPEIIVLTGDPETYEHGWPRWGHACDVVAGETVVVSSNTSKPFSPKYWPVTYPNFAGICKKGDNIFVGRYLSTGTEGSTVTLEVTSVDGDEVSCVAMNDARLSGLVTMFIKDLDHEEGKAMPILTARDKERLKMLADIKSQGSDLIDFLSLSFTRCVADIEYARKYLDSIGLTNCKIIAKVETMSALQNFESILAKADGIVVSRGNLGIDVELEKFPMLQKYLIRCCSNHGIPVLTTRVVDSMTISPRPTRAEATDISNAVIDGIDGIILGAETLRGQFPVITVQTVLQCARAAEKTFNTDAHFKTLMKNSGAISQLESMASSTVRVADKIEASLIVVVTGTGRTSRLVAKYRPKVPVISLTVPRIRAQCGNRWHFSGRHQTRQSMIVRGLFPMLAIGSIDEAAIIEDTARRAAALGIAKPNDQIVILYNPLGGEVPVIKLISMDKAGTSISSAFGSMNAVEGLAKAGKLPHVPSMDTLHQEGESSEESDSEISDEE